MSTQIGRLIATMRKKRGLTQVELAERSKIKSAQYISNMERGLAPLPRFRVKSLAKALETPISKFISASVKDFENFLISEIR